MPETIGARASENVSERCMANRLAVNSPTTMEK